MSHRVIFNCWYSLGELFHAAFLKGKEGLDTTALPHCARTQCLPARDVSSPLQRQLRAKQIRFWETSSVTLSPISSLLAAAELSTAAQT